MAEEFWPVGHEGYPGTFIGWGEGNFFGHIDVTHWKNGQREEKLPYDLREKEIELMHEIRSMLIERTKKDPDFAERFGVNINASEIERVGNG